MLAELDDDPRWLVLDTEYRDRDLVKQVGGARYDARRKVWRARTTWPTCLQLRGVFGGRLEVGPNLRAWARSRRAEIGLRDEVRAAADCEGASALYPYQRVGAMFLELGGGLLTDEMGLGKTVQACVAIAELGATPALVVAPLSVLRVWEAELGRWTPELAVSAARGTATQRRKALEAEADVYLVNYDAIRSHSRLAGYGNIALERCESCGGTAKDAKCQAHARELNREWGAVVFDEAHNLKSPKAQRTRAAWAIADGAGVAWALTGTPIANHPGDLWSLLRLVAPDEWPSRTRFVDRYCQQGWSPYGMEIVGLRPDTIAEFHAAVDHRMLRRTKAEVLTQLPPLVTETREVALPPKQRKRYDEFRKKQLTLLDDETALVATNPLAVLSRLRLLAIANVEDDGDGGVRLCEPSPVLDELEAVLEELGDKPAVVWAEHTDVLDLAAARLGEAAVVVHGKVAPKVREHRLDDWLEGRHRVLLLSLGVGAEGLSLTRSDTFVYLERSWSMVRDLQSMNRGHRPGAEAHERVLAIDVQTSGTVATRVTEVLHEKGDMLEEVVRDRDRLRELLG